MSHTAPKTLSDYRKDIDSALEDSFLRRTLDTFAVAYRANREAVFKEVDERGLIKQIGDGLKILGHGELNKKLTVKATKLTKTAQEKINAAGGSVEVIG